MGSLFRALMNLPIFQSVLRPVTRLMVGVIAIPIFRFILRRVFRLQDLNDELEKDLEEWFRGALLLLAASANMEHLLFGWLTRADWLDHADWFTMGLRLMLAIGVIEAMPDQEIFAVIHPGPPRLKPGRGLLKELWQKRKAFIKGVLCRHLNRSSPVLAMMCAIVGSQLPTAAEADPDFQRHWERWMVGWTCYLLAITQYLIIGLITTKDRAMDVLAEFDRAVAQRRKELIDEFKLQEASPRPAGGADPRAMSVPVPQMVRPAPFPAPVRPAEQSDENSLDSDSERKPELKSDKSSSAGNS